MTRVLNKISTIQNPATGSCGWILDCTNLVHYTRHDADGASRYTFPKSRTGKWELFGPEFRPPNPVLITRKHFSPWPKNLAGKDGSGLPVAETSGPFSRHGFRPGY